jgi:hypothetical protein
MTPGKIAIAAEVSLQVEKICGSNMLHGSEMLRNLLVYLAKSSIERPGRHVKEHEIATQVLGRNEDFDGRLDSAVRVQAARLRSKLAEYYMVEGSEDDLVIEIPKGAYCLDYHFRPALPITHRSERSTPSARASWVYGWVAAVVVSLISVGLWVWTRPASPPVELQSFWRGFVAAREETLVVFSNPRLMGTLTTGLTYYREGADPPQPVYETYTGTGTLMAVYRLTAIFGQFRKSLMVKRGQLLSWDDVQNRNLIFIGSPDHNLQFVHLPPLQEFNFKSLDAGPHRGQSSTITNEHPKQGEEPFYFSSANRPFTHDYAIVALVPAFNSAEKVLILAGTNTYGTQAAADFVCEPTSVTQLLTRLGVGRGASVPYFEALLHVSITEGVPVQSQLVLVKPRKRAASSK